MQHRLQLKRRQAGVLAEDQRGDARRCTAWRSCCPKPGSWCRRARRRRRRRRARRTRPAGRDWRSRRASRPPRGCPRRSRTRSATGNDSTGMLWAAATSTVRRKYAVSASSCRMIAELPLGRREAHVDHVVALLDRPAQPGEQDLPGALESGAEHPHRVDLHLRGDRADDACARGSVPAQVSLGVLVGDGPALLVERDHDCAGTSPTSGWPSSTPLSRMHTLTPSPDRAAERPLGVDALRQRVRDPDLRRRRAGQRPRRQRLAPDGLLVAACHRGMLDRSGELRDNVGRGRRCAACCDDVAFVVVGEQIDGDEGSRGLRRARGEDRGGRDVGR